MARPLVWINGKIVPESKASVPVTDSAFLFGYGVFETLRGRGGKVLFLEDHLSRMKRNAARLGLGVPWSFAAIKKAILQTWKRSGLKEATIRMTLSENPTLHKRIPPKPHLVIHVKPFDPYPEECYRQGGRLILIRSARNDAPAIATIKSTNYLVKLMARKEIQKKGAVEGVLLNQQGEVTEGGSSNLFLVRHGRLITPPLDDGLMPGTRRKAIGTLAKKMRIPFSEETLHTSDLFLADEIFVTSTLKDILPIRSFEGKKIGSESPGPITRRLMKGYGCIFLRAP